MSKQGPSGAGVTLATPLREVPLLSAKASADLATIGVTRVWQLLTHLPHRHEKIEPLTPLAELAPDRIVGAEGEITASRVAGHGRKARFEAVLSDGTGRLDLVWFNAGYLRQKLHPGHRLRVQGTVKRRGPGLQMANPEFQILDDEHEGEAQHEATPEAKPEVEARAESRDARATWRPVYPAGERISSKRVGAAIRRMLPVMLPLIEDHLPEAFIRERSMPGLAEAYRKLHAPEDERDIASAMRRLAYDELLMLQLAIARRRAERDASKAPVIVITPEIDARIRGRLPFSLTKAQSRVVGEIAGDLAKTTPANRLVQGDVGSGKTAVAAYAMLGAIACAHQAALIAPTTLLAEQHLASLRAMLDGARVRVALLTSATPGDERREILAGLASGEIGLLVSTHSILSEQVEFASLGLVVIDEQHRFGVRQRAGVRQKGEAPHTIIMTATPIPRTIALGLFGDMDISTIDELPPGRPGIATRVVEQADRAKVYAHVRERLDKGERAYIVAPSIGSEDLASVERLAGEMRSGPLAGLPVEVMHGRMPVEERDRAMARFRTGETVALIATTVIEVGVDVPEATMMIIEGADRFGLAQLHQLRGRVGRGAKRGLCVAIAPPDAAAASERLKAFNATTDGFEIAEADYRLRGAGQLAGERQAGASPLMIADMQRDADLLNLARHDASAMIERDPELDGLALLRSRLFKRLGDGVGLADIG